jgi:hypothetical protein
MTSGDSAYESRESYGAEFEPSPVIVCIDSYGYEMWTGARGHSLKHLSWWLDWGAIPTMAEKPEACLHKGASLGTLRDTDTRLQRPKGLTPVDTTLTPPRTQYGATQGKAKKRNRLRYASFANPCNTQKQPTAHS